MHSMSLVLTVRTCDNARDHQRSGVFSYIFIGIQKHNQLATPACRNDKSLTFVDAKSNAIADDGTDKDRKITYFHSTNFLWDCIFFLFI